MICQFPLTKTGNRVSTNNVSATRGGSSREIAAVVKETRQDTTTKIIAGCVLGAWVTGSETPGITGPGQPCQQRRAHWNGERLLAGNFISSQRIPDLCKNARSSLSHLSSLRLMPPETSIALGLMKKVKVLGAVSPLMSLLYKLWLCFGCRVTCICNACLLLHMRPSKQTNMVSTAK